MLVRHDAIRAHAGVSTCCVVRSVGAQALANLLQINLVVTKPFSVVTAIVTAMGVHSRELLQLCDCLGLRLLRLSAACFSEGGD
ncbi:hypothetical protein M758_10G149100 [Ceratodon purpureus]|nr:hypothetical protein M758_10G149100 [Ceratodon purpureus]